MALAPLPCVKAADSPIYVSAAVDLPAGKLTYFAPRGVGALLGAGTLESVAPGTLTDTAAAWTEDLFNGNAYLEIAGGDHEGYTTTIVDTAAGVLTLADDLSSLTPALTAGTPYVIRRHLTVESIFGPANEAGLATGPQAGAADQVMVHTAATQSKDSFFYKDSGSWRDAADTYDAGSEGIQPFEGFIVSRVAGSDTTAYMQLQVQSGKLVVPIHRGFNIVGTGFSLGAMTLQGSGLSGILTGGLNPRTSDGVHLVNNATGALGLYFFFNPAGTANDRWVSAAYAPSNAVALTAGSVLIIERKAGPSLDWTVVSEIAP